MTSDLTAGDANGSGALPAPRRVRSGQGVVVLAIAAGGGVGALARYALALGTPGSPADSPAGFPWATFTANVLGCALIGALMVVVERPGSRSRLARPFLGVGVLGGFTTFSGYVVEAYDLIRPGAVPVASAYLAGTLFAAVAAVSLGVAATRRLLENRRPPDRRRPPDGRVS